MAATDCFNFLVICKVFVGSDGCFMVQKHDLKLHYFTAFWLGTLNIDKYTCIIVKVFITVHYVDVYSLVTTLINNTQMILIYFHLHLISITLNGLFLILKKSVRVSGIQKIS